jgi:hypothetical protein
MTTRFAINVVGYIDDKLDKYTASQIFQMLNRKSIEDCFKPLHVVEIITQQMNKSDPIPLDEVRKKKLGHKK